LLLGTSFLGVLDARPLGLLLGERTLAGRDLPVHLRLIAQPRLALTLLSLLAAFDSLADMLALEPPALGVDQVARIGVELAFIGRLLAFIGQRFPLIRDPLALLGDLLTAIRSPLAGIQAPNPPLDPFRDVLAACRNPLTLASDRLALLSDPFALLSNPLTLHRDTLAFLHCPDRPPKPRLIGLRLPRAWFGSLT
jgi:hypothetical protein